MKNRKIHPSPSSPSPGSPSGSSSDVLAVLKLLPAAILALTAVLGFEDKEVVAYLMMRSINGPAAAAAAAEDRKRCRRVVGVVHRPLFDCGCFDCYTSFWSRWDCSPDREIIHMAIEGFEEHLSSSEKKGKGRRRERREKKKEIVKEKEVVVVSAAAAAEENNGLVEEAVSVSECDRVKEEEEEVVVVTGLEVVVSSPPVSLEKRRGWPDVMGMFNSRLWSLWSPGL